MQWIRQPLMIKEEIEARLDAVEELSKEFEGRVNVGKVNVDHNPQLNQQIRTIQTQSIQTVHQITLK